MSKSSYARVIIDRSIHRELDYLIPELLAEKIGKEKAHALVEAALAKGGSFIDALGQLKKELSDEKALLGYSPQFVDRLLADLKRK